MIYYKKPNQPTNNQPTNQPTNQNHIVPFINPAYCDITQQL